MIRLARPLLGNEEIQAVTEVLESGWLVQGERVASFEQLLQPHVGAAHVAACSSGTAALQLALAALALPPGTPVLVPTYTFPATINSVLLTGLEPIPVDVDPSTYNLCPTDTAKALERIAGPKVILAVHQFGLPAPIDELLEHEFLLVEDAACALGASLQLDDDDLPVAAGGIGLAGCFSFHPRKLITTGEGGAVTTNDPEIDARVRILRNHGITPDGEGGTAFTCASGNLRLSELHAAVGVVQVGRLEALLSDRQRIADGYNERLAPLCERGLELPRVPLRAAPNWQSYVIRVPEGRKAADIIGALGEREVQSTIGARCLHREPAYRDLDHFDRSFPGAEDASERAVALPVASGLTDAELDQVAEALAEVL